MPKGVRVEEPRAAPYMAGHSACRPARGQGGEGEGGGGSEGEGGEGEGSEEKGGRINYLFAAVSPSTTLIACLPHGNPLPPPPAEIIPKQKCL